jgi:hypothetical protein
MSSTSNGRKDNDGDSSVMLEGVDDACHLLRQDLEALRSNRIALAESRRKETELMEYQYRTAKEKLRRKLPEYANIATYRQFLRYYQRDAIGCGENNGENREARNSIYSGSSRNASHLIPSSNYIIQQETPLLSALHRSFLVLPHQKALLEEIYEKDIYPYFRKEIEAIELDSLQVTDNWMSRLSDQAEENDALYNSYRTQLESIETEVKRYRSLLLQQRAEMNLGKDGEKGYDENSVLSETDCSADSEDDISSQGEGGAGFLKEALLLLNPTRRQDVSSPSKIEAISDTIHDHFSKGGAAFQIAANNFLLPFTSKDNCSKTGDDKCQEEERQDRL